ncbi:MAG: hypothetical protein ABIL70_07800 [candidate division WOR-3 bacterium]
MFMGIGQELNVLHKSFVLLLTLSQKFSLPRVIENSPTGKFGPRRETLPKEPNMVNLNPNNIIPFGIDPSQANLTTVSIDPPFSISKMTSVGIRGF